MPRVRIGQNCKETINIFQSISFPLTFFDLATLIVVGKKVRSAAGTATGPPLRRVAQRVEIS